VVHVLGFHASYRCRHAGVCCTSGWAIPVEAPLYRSLGGRFSLIVEFALLLGTMLLVASGGGWWAWGYGLYTGMNAFSAWLILTGKV